MTRIATLWAAIVTGLLSTFVIPAAAWASENDVLRRGPRIGGFFGVIGGLCCLVVVGGIVLVVVMMSRRKR